MTSVCTSYGLSLPASTIAPLHQFQPDIHSFLIGTCSTYEHNKIVQLDFREDANHIIDTYQYNHPNEIISLSTNGEHTDKLITVSRKLNVDYHKEKTSTVGVLYQLPSIELLNTCDDHNNVELIKLAEFPDVSDSFLIPTSSPISNTTNSTPLPSAWNNPAVNLQNPLSIFCSPNPSPTERLVGYNTWDTYFSAFTGTHQPQQTVNIHFNDSLMSGNANHGLQRIIWQQSSNASISSHTASVDSPSQPAATPQNSTLTSRCLGQYLSGVALYDLQNESDIKHISSTKPTQFANSMIRDVCWNKHRYGEQFFVATNNNVYGYDTRIMKPTFSITAPHGQHYINKVDTNFIKNYTILTTGDDGCISIWDSRKPVAPLISVRFFTSTITTCEYNIYHDNLIFGGSLDGTVALMSISSHSTSSLLNTGGTGTSYQQFSSKPTYTRPTSVSLSGHSTSSRAPTMGMGHIGGSTRNKPQFDPNMIIQRVEPPYSYGSEGTKGNKNQQNPQNIEEKRTIQEIYESAHYVPSEHSVSLGNYYSASKAGGNGPVGIGDALMSYHNEHSTSIINGCWSSSSPWHYVTLSADGVIIVNQVIPENEQYKLLL